MKLRATAMPTATPTPVLPTATAKATAPMVASMSDVLDASRSTAPTLAMSLPITLSAMNALVRDRMMLVDSDAPPATPTLVPSRPAAIEIAAANDVTSISALSVARTITSPPPVVRVSTLTMLAVTSLSIVLCARARPIDTAMLADVIEPEMLADAASAKASIVESSVARTVSVPPVATVVVPATSAASTIDASTVLSISLKLIAPVAVRPTAVETGLRATARPMPKASDSISAALSAVTLSAPSASIVESVTSACVALSISLIVRPKPSDAATAVFWLTAIESASAPTVELMFDSSLAVTLTVPPLPSRVVRLLPFCTLAWVLLRILFRPAEPAPATAKAEPLVELATPPAAPMASAKIVESISALTVIAPPAVTSEFSMSAQTVFGSRSLPRSLIENAAPNASAAAVLLLEVPMATATAPAPAMISAELMAVTETASPARTVLLRIVAVVSASISLSEPEPAPATAKPEPFLASATDTAPATVKDLMSPVDSAATVSPPFAPTAQIRSLLSTNASVSVWMSLKASAIPADTAKAVPDCGPLAMPTANAPAMVRISESSPARTSASLRTRLQSDDAAKSATVAGSRLVVNTSSHSAVSV